MITLFPRSGDPSHNLGASHWTSVIQGLHGATLGDYSEATIGPKGIYVSSYGYFLLHPHNTIILMVTGLLAAIQGVDIYKVLHGSGFHYLQNLLSPVISVRLIRSGRIGVLWVTTVEHCYLVRTKQWRKSGPLLMIGGEYF